MAEATGYVLVPALIPFYLPLLPCLEFSYVLALVRGIKIVWLSGEGLTVPLDLAGVLPGLPVLVVVKSAGMCR